MPTLLKMNFLKLLAPTLLLLVLTACGNGGTEEAQKATTNYLEEEFAPATYAAFLDSAKSSTEISAEDYDLVMQFIRDHATIIPKGHTLQSLLEGAQGLNFTQTEGVEVMVTKANITTDRKIYGFHLHLEAKNKGDIGIARLRGYMQWLSEEGTVLKNSPVFSLRGELPPGGTLDNVLLQTAYYKPTGNELSDPKNKAWRDTLRSMEKTAGNFDSTRFRFKLVDLRFANGLTPEKYWLRPPAERATLKEEKAEKTRPTSLQKWPKKNKEWMEKLTAGLGGHYLETTPILTNKGELTHGEYLVFDRINKVNKFFATQAKIPTRRINPTGINGKLVHFEEVDFWKWPTELRIYASDVD